MRWPLSKKEKTETGITAKVLSRWVVPCLESKNEGEGNSTADVCRDGFNHVFNISPTKSMALS